LKAAVEQQKMQEEIKAAESLALRNREHMQSMLDSTTNLMKDAEKEKRETSRQNLVTTFNILGNAASSFFMNPRLIGKMAYLLFIGFLTFHFTKLALAMTTAVIMGRFGKPKLVRETSKIYTSNLMAIPFLKMKKLVTGNIRRTEKDLLEGVILEKNLEDQLREISYAVLNRKKHFAPSKNLMFYGPPGTGKTLFAKKLAMKSGLEYAVMVGSDIAPLGPLAV
jgi:ATPase family AAA domain-containing protein 3A/B